MLKGSDYESHVARLASRFLHRQLGIAATVFSSQRNQAALATLLDDAEKRGTIDADETDELDKTDLILTADGPTDYILAEISITIQQHDIDRAAHRAALLAKATGQTVTPFAIRRPGGTRPQPPRRPDHPHPRTHRRLNPARSGRQTTRCRRGSSKSSCIPHQGKTYGRRGGPDPATHKHMEVIRNENTTDFSWESLRLHCFCRCSCWPAAALMSQRTRHHRNRPPPSQQTCRLSGDTDERAGRIGPPPGRPKPRPQRKAPNQRPHFMTTTPPARERAEPSPTATADHRTATVASSLPGEQSESQSQAHDNADVHPKRTGK